MAAKKIDLEGLEDCEPDPVVLFEDQSDYGPPWSYELTTVEIEQGDLIDEDGDPVRGMCHFNKRRILINADEPEWRQNETILHEMMHAKFENHGMDWLTADREEFLIRYLSPRLYNALERLGFKWPERSDSAKELSRKAILDSSE